MKSASRLSAQFLIAAVGCILTGAIAAQEVAEIPFFHAEEGSAALGAGIRFGQNPYLATDSEDQRLADLIP